MCVQVNNFTCTIQTILQFSTRAVTLHLNEGHTAKYRERRVRRENVCRTERYFPFPNAGTERRKRHPCASVAGYACPTENKSESPMARNRSRRAASRRDTTSAHGGSPGERKVYITEEFDSTPGT